jgi:RHS repeat-associated core domain
MYVANTHLKPVIGIDIHFVNLPFPFVPLPHPYIGLVIDPFDYIPFIGATVKVNNVPRGNTDTGGLLITFIHIPFGAGFTLMPMIGHDSQNFFGSKRVHVDGAPMSGAGFVLMTCNDIGIPLSFSPGKKFKPIPSLYLPTSFSIPLQWGKPVYVGGPLVPNFSVIALLKAFAFGSFLKVLGKAGGRMMNKLAKKAGKSKASKKKAPRNCKTGREPVDLITGRVTYEQVDFELPGLIPIEWKRNWDSDARIEGPMGYGTAFSYDRYVQIWPDDDCITVNTADGREMVFPLLAPGEQFTHPHEKVMLRRKQNGHFLLADYPASLYFHFNEETSANTWHLSFIEDYSGNRVLLHYKGGYLAGMTDSVGRKIVLSLDEQHRVIQVTVAHRGMEQVMVSYAYNKESDLVRITDALNQGTQIAYVNHLMVVKTDRNGQSFYWEYDQQRRCIHTWGDGGVLEGHIKYGKGYNVVTNSLGEHTTYFYDENNLCIQETDHYGNHRYTEYTEYFEVYRQIDETGNITGYEYDELGRLTKKIMPDGNTLQFQYNEFNQVVLVIYPDGSSLTRGYDDWGRLRFVNQPNGRITAYRYNENGQVTTIVENDNQRTMLLYDEDENLVSIQTPAGGQQRWQYDALGRCIQATNATGESRYYEYDALGRVRKAHMPDGNTLKFKYDGYDDITEVSDRQSTVWYEYTPMGQVKKRKQGASEIQYYYDTEERLCTVVNEAGNHYRFDYNMRGEIVGETTFSGIHTRYERDAAGRLISAIRPGNRYTRFEYDANSRLVRAEHHDGSWEYFSYDKNGQIREAVNEHSVVRFTRNRMGFVEQVVQNDITIQYKYNHWGNRIHISSNAGADISFERNGEGQVKKLKASAAAASWQASIQYNAEGLETERIMPGGIVCSWQYDHTGRPEAQTVSRNHVIQSWKKYTWGINNRLTSVLDALRQGATRFKYDTLGNLVFAQYADNSIVHRTFDVAGNVFDTTGKSGRSYNSAGALLESKKYHYQYDEEGRLISKTDKHTHKRTSYEWNANGTLKKVLKPDGAIEFKYDAFGRRIEKTVTTAKDAEPRITRWAWDHHVMLHEWTFSEKEKPVAIVNEWGEMRYNKPEPLHNLITWVYDDESYTPSARLQNGKAHSIIADQLGTPTAAYDENGRCVWESELDIYGRTHTLQGDKSFIPFRYPGQYEDAETGLYYNRYRYYNAGEGVYISSDPIGMSGGENLYRYVNSTATQMDPLGLATTNANVPRYVYRALTQAQEAQAKAGLHIDPKDPTANYTMDEHINNGKLNTQYISTGYEQKTAEFYAKPNPKRGKNNWSTVIRVDTTKLDQTKFFDCADGIDPQTGKPFTGNAFRWSQKDKEVLILGGIPANAYEIVPRKPPTPTCKTK